MMRIYYIVLLCIASIFPLNSNTAQIDLPQYTGIYVTFEDSPAILQGNSEYLELLQSIQRQFQVDSLQVPFPNARRETLRKTRKIRLPDATLYPVLQSILEASKLVSFTELIGVPKTAEGSLVMDRRTIGSSPDIVAPTPDCPNPFIYDDPGALETNHIDYMQLPCAWSVTQGSADITIGVVDIYFYPSHPDLNGKIDGVFNNSLPLSGDDDHGTAVAGGAAAIVNNDFCVAGAGFNTHVNLYDWSPGILEQMWKAHQDGNPIINLSGYYSSWSNGSDIATECALDIVHGGSLITYAARGANSEPFKNIPGLVVVGMGWEDGAYRPYDYGVEDLYMDMIVPIRNSARLQNPNGAVCEIGPANTSMAAPHVAGVAALMLDVNPCLTPIEIEELLTADTNTNDIRNANDPSWAHLLQGVGYMNAYKAVTAAQNYTSPQNLTINNGQSVVIDDEQGAQYQYIEIKTGGMLSITNSFVSMHEGGRIIVNRGAKLLVRNSEITRVTNPYCTADPRWDGISVAGNNQREQPDMYDSNGTLNPNKTLSSSDAGVAMLLEGTIISHAKEGLSTEIPGIPYADQVARWGGLFIADRAEFIDNWKAVAFMKYPDPAGNYSFVNKSTFIDCYFMNSDINDLLLGGAGMTVWDNDGIEISGSVFENLRLGAYSGLDAGASFTEGNTFILNQTKYNHTHLKSESTHPFAAYLKVGTSSNDATPNRFISTVSGNRFIHSDATDGEGGLIIENNEFLTSNGNRSVDPLYIVGASRYSIENNLFETGAPAIWIQSTGNSKYAGNNIIGCNTFYQQRQGIYYTGNNDGSVFRNNSFETSTSSYYDVRINDKIDLYQGSYTNPANNCFSSGNDNIDVNTAPSFYYYYNNSQSCQIPASTAGFSPISTSYVSSYCNQSNLEKREDGERENSITEVHDQLMFLRGANSEAEIRQKYLLRSDISDIINTRSDNVSNKKELGLLIKSIVQTEDPDLLIRGYGLLTKFGSYEAARRVLSMLDTNPKFASFAQVQRINLSRLEAIQAGMIFEPSMSDKAVLRAAIEDSRAGSYARAILVFYGSTLPSSGEPYRKPEYTGLARDNNIRKQPEVDLYPNPASKLVYVNLKNNSNIPVSLTVVDASGRKIVSYTSIFNGKEIPVSGLRSGVYVFPVQKWRLRYQPPTCSTITTERQQLTATRY